MTASRTESSGATSSTSPCTSSPTGLVSATGTSAGWLPGDVLHADEARNASPAGLANWARTGPRGVGLSVLGSVARATNSMPPPVSSGVYPKMPPGSMPSISAPSVAGLQRDVPGAHHPDVVGHLHRVVGDHRVGGKLHQYRPGGQRGELVGRHRLERACARRGMTLERHYERSARRCSSSALADQVRTFLGHGHHGDVRVHRRAVWASPTRRPPAAGTRP